MSDKITLTTQQHQRTVKEFRQSHAELIAVVTKLNEAMVEAAEAIIKFKAMIESVVSDSDQPALW